MMGQIMRKTSGKVNPVLSNEILMNKLQDV
ncbi:Aspartyl/glutamyl-tRNA(Asn/Gln) amidotransferase subunit B [Borrelia duttonii CR2A]|nr:Aspartyl/glutamyl-tRNA(Asn/Gln) amidotransferase subunit B [Borrelia duttonii CR2A]